MRKLIFGFVTAGVVGTSMIALPPALASSHSEGKSESAASQSKAQKVKEQEDKDKKDKNDKDKKDKDDKDKGDHDHHGGGGDHDGDDDCNYPTNDAHLSLSGSRESSKIKLTGTLKKNKCDLDDEDVEVFDAESGKLVGSVHTNSHGSYSISLRAGGSSTYVAKFAGHNGFSPATSNTVKVKADH